MEKVIINSYEDFEKLVGQQIGVSEYVGLPQERINLFADATLDHQWIHVDTERAKVESPFMDLDKSWCDGFIIRVWRETGNPDIAYLQHTEKQTDTGTRCRGL